MSISDNPFVGLPIADLIELQTMAQQALKDVLTGGQSYSFPGRTFTRANLRELQEMIGNIGAAISFTTPGVRGGVQVTQAYINTQSKW
jgi:hypothetical protein